MLWNDMVISSSRNKMCEDFLRYFDPENGITASSGDVGNQLPDGAASHPRRSETSS
jgi:hypothetical protein